MSEEEGAVSLWVGRAASPEAFSEAVTTAYSEDGDFLSSAFGRAFGLGQYDEDFQEAERFPDLPRAIEDALAGFSYYETIAPLFKAIPASALQDGENCIVLLYNHRYDGTESRWSEGSVSLRFVGAVRYR